MKRIILISVVGTFMLSCGGAGDTESTDGSPADSTEVAEDDRDMDEEFIYEGDDRGDYLLYGYDDIDESEASSIAEFNAAIELDREFNGKLNVSIFEVCQMAGCWITFKTDPVEEDELVRVYFRDHFTIPPETPEGTQAILAGSTAWDTTSVEMQKHLLDDKAKAGEKVPQEEYDAIKRDKIELVFNCEAILVAKL
jgi:hypothetical protein